MKCCTLEDYTSLALLPEHKAILLDELEGWHEYYLPVGGTVLDVGAGCGETARFYLIHGAHRVICVEGDDAAIACLVRNFGHDARVVIIPSRVDKIKIDVEGAELGMDLETHFAFPEFRLMRAMGDVNQWRLLSSTADRLDQIQRELARG